MDSTKQLDIFTRKVTNEAIERANVAANENWKREVFYIIRVLAQSGAEFTTDDVWRQVHYFETREPRALGAVMRQAQSMGLIEAVPNKFVKSTRPECHRRPLQVWRRHEN